MRFTLLNKQINRPAKQWDLVLYLPNERNLPQLMVKPRIYQGQTHTTTAAALFEVISHAKAIGKTYISINTTKSNRKL